MPGLSEIKLGWLVIRATIGVLILLTLVTALLALVGVEPFKTLYGVQKTFNDPAPLMTWLKASSASLMAWLDTRPIIAFGLIPGIFFILWLMPYETVRTR